MFLALSILLSALVAALCFGARGTRLHLRHRMLHIRYLIPTLLFAIAGVVFFADILSLLNRLLSVSAIRSFLYSIIPSANPSAGFYWLVTLLCCLFLMLCYWIMMLLLSGLWVKPLSKKPYLQSKNPLDKFWNAISGIIYHIYEDRVVLPPVMLNAGRWFRFMRIAFGLFLIVQALVFSICLQFGWTILPENTVLQLVKSNFMLPVLAYIVLEQLELFLAADAKKNDPAPTDTEEIGVSLDGNFDRLAGVYNYLYGGNALISYYSGGGSSSVQRELFNGIQAEQRDRANNPALLDALCRNVQCVTTPVSHYINGLVDLINGKSIAVFDTPWGEFDAYYLSYIQHQLTLGKTVLVLCKTKSQVAWMKKRITAIFEKINIATPIWRIQDLDKLVDGETEVFLCTEEQFLAAPIRNRYPLFFKNLQTVVVLESYDLLCREGAYFSRLFDGLLNRGIQFVFYVPENNTDIRNRLQERIDGRAVGMCENPYSNDRTTMLFWRSESIYKPQLAISKRLYHDFGVAYSIAIIAARYDIPLVSVLAPESIPVDTYQSLVTREYSKILLEDYLKSGAINLSSVIRNNDHSIADPATLTFSIIYDENNNLINVADTWLSYGGSASAMLNIVSEPYMLRDYFACNIASLSAENTGLQMIIPGCSLSAQAPAIALLLRMRRGISCAQLMQFAKQHNISATRAEQVLESLLHLVFGKDCRYQVYDCFTFSDCSKPEFKDNTYHYSCTVTLINEMLYRSVCNMTENFVRLEGAHEDVVPMNKDDLYNRYLPRQCATFGNVRYRIEEISQGALRLSTEETVDMEERYHTLYDITDFERIHSFSGQTISTEKLSADFFEARVTRRIDSYYAFPGVMNFSKPGNVKQVCLDSPIEETKTVPCLELTLHTSIPGNQEKLANTLCFLLRGAMETFLPHNYQDLLIFSDIDRDALCRDVRFAQHTDLLEDPIPSDMFTGFENFQQLDPAILRLIPQINGSATHPNKDGEIHLYLVQFSEADTGLLTALAADINRILQTICKYLEWEEGRPEDAPTYLRFGYSSTPGIFDPVAAIVCLSGVAPQPQHNEKRRAGQVHIAGGDNCARCSFCGKPVPVVSHKMDDGRIMCVDCHNHATSSRKEIKDLLQKARELLKKHYGITLPEQIGVSFKSASAIRKACGTSGGGRVLGFYNLKRRDIWIERGGPESCVLSTLVHELTHAWQHANIDINNAELKYIEGHSSYVEVECLRSIQQSTYADFLENNLLTDESVYGEGFRFWKAYISDENDKNIFHHVSANF